MQRRLEKLWDFFFFPLDQRREVSCEAVNDASRFDGTMAQSSIKHQRSNVFIWRAALFVSCRDFFDEVVAEASYCTVYEIYDLRSTIEPHRSPDEHRCTDTGTAFEHSG